MIELNLLPDVKLEYVHSQKARRRVITGVSIGGLVAVGLVAVFALYVYAIQPVRGLVIDNGIKDANTKLEAVKDLGDYLTIQQQLNDLPALHQGKPIYSRMIGFLSVLNPSAPNTIKVTQLQVDAATDANTFKILGYAPTYTAATVFESTLKSAQFSATGLQEPISLFTDVKLADTALGQDSSGNKVVTFTATVTADPAVFAFASQNASVSVPSKNATNSAQNVPDQVFATGGTQ